MLPGYTPSDRDTRPNRWDRATIAEKLSLFDNFNQRAFAREHQIPRSSFQHWLKRSQLLPEVSCAAAFLETPEGLEFLHRLVVAALFVITQLAGGGIRLVCSFLELSGLSPFVAASYGSQQKAVARMEELIGEFGSNQQTQLAYQMPHKHIALCEDETFHPETCLVGMEPESGYILTEKYSKHRDAVTWNQATNEALEGLNVTVTQCVSDQARGLIAHAEKGLGVHHAPDLFHIQHEVSKAVSLPLASKVRKAKRQVEAAEQVVAQQRQFQQRYEKEVEQNGRGQGRPPEFEKNIQKAQQRREEALAALERKTNLQEKARSAN